MFQGLGVQARRKLNPVGGNCLNTLMVLGLSGFLGTITKHPGIGLTAPKGYIFYVPQNGQIFAKKILI